MAQWCEHSLPIIVQMAYSARNQVDKEPFRGRATSIVSSFKRFKRNVSVNPNVLSTFTPKNVEMRRLCNFPHETGLFQFKKIQIYSASSRTTKLRERVK